MSCREESVMSQMNPYSIGTVVDDFGTVEYVVLIESEEEPLTGWGKRWYTVERFGSYEEAEAAIARFRAEDAQK
jgi:hypothetical protein